MLITGCRPKETAYVVRANSVQPNDYPDFRDCDWKATMPKEVTKTKRDYKWPVPKGENQVVGMLRSLHKLAPNLEEELGTLAVLTRSLDSFMNSVLKAAEKERLGATYNTPAGTKHTMRTIRAWHGTKYAMEAEIAKRQKEPVPFNPLQHSNEKTLLRRYTVNLPDAVEAGRILSKRGTKQREKQEAAAEQATRHARQSSRLQPGL